MNFTLIALFLCVSVLSTSQTSGLKFDLDHVRPIGTGLSQGRVNATEQTLFQHKCVNTVCALLHLWFAGSPVVDNTTVRVYVDNEEAPSIEFQVSLGVGVGFDEQSAPCTFPPEPLPPTW